MPWVLGILQELTDLGTTEELEEGVKLNLKMKFQQQEHVKARAIEQQQNKIKQRVIAEAQSVRLSFFIINFFAFLFYFFWTFFEFLFSRTFLLGQIISVVSAGATKSLHPHPLTYTM